MNISSSEAAVPSPTKAGASAATLSETTITEENPSSSCNIVKKEEKQEESGYDSDQVWPVTEFYFIDFLPAYIRKAG